MQLVDLTLPTPGENLALDEALLEEAEQLPLPRECLRLWESPVPMVVVGRSSRVADEVNVAHCRAQGIPILRRISGGAAIVAGPGSLMYALVLSYDARPELRSIDVAHRFVLTRIQDALRPLAPAVVLRGTSDLALDDVKFSGNSLRCKRRHFLYHGTLLYDFDLEQIESCLTMPPRQPPYRRQRTHRSFVTNLPISAAELRSALAFAWQTNEIRRNWPRDRVRGLVATRYALDEWNEQR